MGVALGLALVLASCGDGKSSSGGSGSSGSKSEVIAVAADPPEYINPLNDNGTAGIGVSMAIFAPLVTTDPNTGKLLNVMADSVTPDKTSQTWTVKLKPGNTFQNGQPVTAKDYVDSWNMTAEGSNAWKNNGFFSKVDGYDALNPPTPDGATPKPTAVKTLSGLKLVDNLTFTVKLKVPFSQFGLTLQYLGLAPLPEEVRKNPDAYKRKPIGNGPYKLAAAWNAGDDLKLAKWDGYKASDAPEADSITYRFIPNADTAYNEFLAGNVDFTDVPSTKVKSFKTDAPDQWVTSVSSGANYLVIPAWDPRFKNPKLRHAFSEAIDRKAFADLVGLSDPAKGLIAPDMNGYRADACKYCDFDATKAKQLLAEAGGFSGPVNINYSTTSATGQIFAEAIGNMLRQNLGLQVKYTGKQSSEITELADSHKLDGLRFSGWGHDYPSIEDYLTPMFKSNGDANFAHYSNPALDAVLAKGDAEPDPDKAIKLYQQAEDIALEDMPLIPLYTKSNAYLHSDKIEPRVSKYVGVSALWATFK
ncbi:peptide ABC transporter substrate-binding protein [Kribbella kalugense]|uniref:Peptide/nickel transport system substrate-binding protein/oligopeptide transport system substrate-binding protein n=1 Tax=Kribbella kalugense TaxID=2512221 RepID=A0A4R8A1M3_9ACTN|nr:ABC transporter substrate-binding protein [Kribbella kalugense]TDW23238.1 peptide/nickel transport system substrate-binding protein/oligopeptide transport system substrate-binding protein [Kribbella kalugense]